MTFEFHLTQLRFRPERTESIVTLGDPYRLHQFVYGLFARTSSGNRILYRVESDAQSSIERPVVIVQSQTSPNPEHEAPFVFIRSKEIQVAVQPMAYRFKARVNPVRTIASVRSGRRGKRVGVYLAEDQIDWFRRRLEKSGIELREFRHQRESWQQMYKHRGPNPVRLTLASALFEGVVFVRDPESAGRMILNGIGPGKGFGFGLFSLARV